jgi:hypothetical protein
MPPELPAETIDKSHDQQYLKIVIDPIRVCMNYKPKFGQGATGLTMEQFQEMHQRDPFYAWFGLDSPLLYAAHKAAGGMTSIYRQIGMGCQRLIQQMFVDYLGITNAEAVWSYQVTKTAGKPQTLSLDGRIPTDSVKGARQEIVRAWLADACTDVGVSVDIGRVLRGAVFEVRQGYKSKDSKRQNADIANAAAAYAAGYLPVVLLLSTQIDTDVVERYRGAKWLVLRGSITGDVVNSTYEFSRDVVGYDLASFFRRHSDTLKHEVEAVLQALLV